MSPTHRDGGFTLIEVVVTMTLLGIMMAIAVSGWSSWSQASEQSGTAREIQSVLRQTQQRAVTEGRSMCVEFDTTADQYSVYRGVCNDGGRVLIQGPMETASPRVELVAPAFVSTTNSANTGVSFTPRGTAWPGRVKVARAGSTKTYTLEVEGLTGRVSLG